MICYTIFVFQCLCFFFKVDDVHVLSFCIWRFEKHVVVSGVKITGSAAACVFATQGQPGQPLTFWEASFGAS